MLDSKTSGRLPMDGKEILKLGEFLLEYAALMAFFGFFLFYGLQP